MAQQYSLAASSRKELGKKVSILRDAGVLPAVVYGRGTAHHVVSVPYAAFEKVYRNAGESSLVDLAVDGGGALKTLIHDVQKNPVSDRYTHVDFFEVNMAEKLNAQIQLKFTGDSKAVKQLGGILVKNISHVEVRCLPADLVHELSVDLSPLATFDDTITVADIPLPSGIEILSLPAGTIIATVMPPMTEEQMKALDEKVVEDVSTVAKVEDEKKKKAADTEGAVTPEKKK